MMWQNLQPLRQQVGCVWDAIQREVKGWWWSSLTFKGTLDGWHMTDGGDYINQRPSVASIFKECFLQVRENVQLTLQPCFASIIIATT